MNYLALAIVYYLNSVAKLSKPNLALALAQLMRAKGFVSGLLTLKSLTSILIVLLVQM